MHASHAGKRFSPLPTCPVAPARCLMILEHETGTCGVVAKRDDFFSCRQLSAGVERGYSIDIHQLTWASFCLGNTGSIEESVESGIQTSHANDALISTLYAATSTLLLRRDSRSL